jgi:hypothetical protein
MVNRADFSASFNRTSWLVAPRVCRLELGPNLVAFNAAKPTVRAILQNQALTIGFRALGNSVDTHKLTWLWSIEHKLAAHGRYYTCLTKLCLC